jgi:hypothetical protein
MENKTEKAINDFIENPEELENNENVKSVLYEREGLIERVDKILITKDGRQLLREQY